MTEHDCGQKVLDLPEWLRERHDIERSTCVVDGCISAQIDDLWTYNIATLNSCCGHGLKNPSVVVPTLEDARYAHMLLQRVDDREWDVLVWRLTKYKSDGEIGEAVLDFIIEQGLVETRDGSGVLVWAEDSLENLAFAAKQAILETSNE